MNLVSNSISILIALGLGATTGTLSFRSMVAAESIAAHSIQAKLVDRCCQVGRERAIESQKFNCKLSAREALSELIQTSKNTSLAFVIESLVASDQNFADQCEMVLESCCLAHHRTRNCESGKQFAKSGATCMDVELSKEATVATESFNDCCMACSLGVLAARYPNGASGQAEATSGVQPLGSSVSLQDRCKLISPLASSLSGQLYEQTYIECCQENLPKISSALLEPGAPIDCSQANPCSQKCLAAGSVDTNTRRRVEQDRCDCFSGYKLASDGLTCNDVDECKVNTHTCNRQSEICANTRGSFKCLARHSGPSARALILSDHDDAAPELSTGDQFSSLRLCAPGSRWSALENRCQTIGGSHEQRSAHLHSTRRVSMRIE